MLNQIQHNDKIIPQDILKAGGLIMTGTIICNKCRKKIDGVCKNCQNAKCVVRVHWQGKYHEVRRNEKGYVLTYDEARDTLIDITKEMKAGTFDPATRTSEGIKEGRFEHQVNLWIEEQEKRYNTNELSWGTYRDYDGYVRNHYSILNDIDVRKIELKDIVKVKDSLNNVSIKTRRNVLNALKTFFKWMIDRGTIAVMPKFPEVTGEDGKQGRPIDYWTQQEVLTRIPEKDRDIISFLMETGMRPGEVCALQVNHFDERKGEVRIERTFTSNKIRETTKQKKKRTIPITEAAQAIAVRNAQGKHPNSFLFINSHTGTNYFPDTLWLIWHKNSGLDIRLYDGTRHSYGSQLATENNLYQVSKLMGHSTIKMTEKYLNMEMTELRKVTDSRKIIALKKNSNRTAIELGNRGISGGEK